MGLNIKPKHIVLDLYQNKYVMIQASQYDIDSRKLIIHVTSDGEFFKIPQKNYDASIEYKKPDNTIGVVDCEILEDGTLSFTITDQMVAVPGYCKCDLLLASNKEAVNTNAFIINVRESAVQGDEYESKDEFTSLTKTVTRARSAITTMSKMQEEFSGYVSESTKTIDHCLDQAERAQAIADQVDEAVLTAVEKAGEVAINAKAAASSATAAQSSANKAKTSEDNAKQYCEEVRNVVEGLDNAFLPMGTITFSQLKSKEKVTGYMYNISDEFVTDNTFKEGSGHTYPVGTNVYCTADGYWDCLAGAQVTGIKGSAETSYRKGNVNITPANLGITVVNNTADKDKPISNAVQAEIDRINQAIIDVDAINEASGSAIILTDTVDGVFTDFKAYGRSSQKQYSGKNKYKRINGYYYNESGNRVASSGWDCSDYIECNENESYTFSCTQGGQLGYWYYYDENKTLISRERMLNNQTITTPSGCEYLTMFLHGSEFTTPNTNVQVEKGTTVTDYEPYIGGVASPNPNYPQEITSVGDNGWFDGELLQGRYNDSGTYVSQVDYICSKNPMPCNSGDIVKLLYGTTMSTICFCFYDENMTVISRPYTSSVTEYEVTAPTNARYVNFHINLASITPQTAKKIVVTINDTYAVKVKSVGKNLLNNTATTQTINGVTFTVNDDGSVTANGTADSNAHGVLTLNTNVPIKKGTYILSGCTNGGSATAYYVQAFGTNNYSTGSAILDTGNGAVATFTDDDVLARIIIVIYKGATVNNLTFYPMLRPVGTDDTYEPYTENVTTIALSEPLRGVGESSDELSPDKVTRRFAEVVFDGSDDEKWSAHSVANWFLIKKPTDVASGSNMMCSHYCYNTTLASTDYGFYIGGTYVNFKNKDISTVTEWKAWLQANPITVVYKLKDPVEETIESVDIVTYDNVTYLTASDNAEMWVQYYSNSNVGQRLAYTNKEMKIEHKHLQEQITENADNISSLTTSVASVKDYQNIKDVYNNDTGTLKARINGQVIELIGMACTKRELEQCLGALSNNGYAPEIMVLCIYSVGSDNSIGRLSMLGDYVVLSDMNNNFISNYTVSFNAMWLVDSTSVG